MDSGTRSVVHLGLVQEFPGHGVPNQPIANLANLSLNGTVSATGDQVILFVGTDMYARTGDNAVNAAASWTIAEFNVFGDGGNGAGGVRQPLTTARRLSFRTRIIYGGTDPPNCTAQGFTAEMTTSALG